jgi:hypothetical protein
MQRTTTHAYDPDGRCSAAASYGKVVGDEVEPWHQVGSN